jgi:DHA2 family multidrug resistance protein
VNETVTQRQFVGREPTKFELAVIVLILAVANFLAVLDLTIANVLVPHIAGSLGASSSDGTWVITGYGVAEAIMVPLTGWLTERFGPVRVFTTCIIGFGFFSFLCGVSTSLIVLILVRVALGICGGPLIPLSQTLLIKIVPKRYATVALAVWTMTTVLAPILGPVLGGLLADNWSWEWAFFINVPLAAVMTLLAWRMLTPHESPIKKMPIDFAGLGLLILAVGSLQIMLGTGQDNDWFNSEFIVALLVVTGVGFGLFIIWEITCPNPIVNLGVFRNRSFSISMVVIALVFGALFGGSVLVPLWLQTNIGYTATWAGFNQALPGTTMVIAAPIAAFLMSRVDLRAVACAGLVICGASQLMRVGFNDHMTFWQMVQPQIIYGSGMMIAVMPLMEMATNTLADRDVASGTGLFNFIRTLSSALSTAIVIATWNNQVTYNKAALVGALRDPLAFLSTIEAGGASTERSHSMLDMMVSGQSVMQATNNVFLILGSLTLLAGALVWLAPKPPKRTNARPQGFGH